MYLKEEFRALINCNNKNSKVTLFWTSSSNFVMNIRNFFLKNNIFSKKFCLIIYIPWLLNYNHINPGIIYSMSDKCYKHILCDSHFSTVDISFISIVDFQLPVHWKICREIWAKWLSWYFYLYYLKWKLRLFSVCSDSSVGIKYIL